MTGPAIRVSLLSEGIQPIWRAVRVYLDRHGHDRRGVISYPAIDPAGMLVLGSLIGRRPAPRLDLRTLETKLVELSVGADLSEALTRLGHPPSVDAIERRSARARTTAAREAIDTAVASWTEPWAPEWVLGVVRAGWVGDLDPSGVVELAADVRRLLDHLDSDLVMSRTELAAHLYGSAHALDLGTRRSAVVAQALRHRFGDLDGRGLWDAAGIAPDRVSAPVLTWAVPVIGASPVANQIRGATGGGLPVHLSLFAIDRYPVEVAAGTAILVVENPRLVEAAAERGVAACVVSAGGNASTAVTTFIRQLQGSGAEVHYHGDFDAAGIGMCRRMFQSGCAPWMMGAGDYATALARAERAGIRLDRDASPCGRTPWDPALEAAFGADRRIVHEEFLIDVVLDQFSAQHVTRAR